MLLRRGLYGGASLFLATALAGCSSGDGFGVTTGTGSRGRVTTATASAGSGTTGGGSTGTSSSGSTGTTGADCGAAWLAGWYDGGNLRQPGECPDSQVELKGRVTDIESISGPNPKPPAFTTPFVAADAFMPGVVATTNACGAFWFCVDAGTQLTPSFDIASYPPSELATFDLIHDTQPEDVGLNQGVMLASNAVFQFINMYDPQPAIDPTLPTLTVAVGYPRAASACSVLSGWTFTLSAPDGGAVASSSLFLSGTSFSQLDAGTSDEGIEIFYDLPSDLSYVTIQGDRPGNDLADGGQVCPCLSTSSGEFTGQIPLVKAGLTIFYYLVQ